LYEAARTKIKMFEHKQTLNHNLKHPESIRL
jgi:hypothetical protein